MDCRLCGAPAPNNPIEVDGHPFCCFGCREVYRTFGADALGSAPRAAAAAAPLANGRDAFLHIDGMHCSSCEVLIERLAEQVEGIHTARSSYATSTAKVTYDPEIIDEGDLPQALQATGYRVRLSSEPAPPHDDRLDLLRVLVGVSLAGIVMMIYIAFFYPAHLGLIDPDDLEPVAWLAYDLAPKTMWAITTVLIAYVGAPIFRGAWVGFRARVLNMDNLLAFAILAAYGYSVGQLLEGSHDLYFDVAATITTVVAAGRYFEQGAKAEATARLTGLIQAWAPKARIRWGGDYRLLELEELRAGDYVLVRQGEPVPVDGTVIDGGGAVDEQLMTGEPLPVMRGPGDKVLGGSMLVEGELEIQTGAKIESRMDNLAAILWNVQSTTSGAQGLADRVARVFVPAVVILALIVGLVVQFDTGSAGAALLAGLATLIVSCPCTFGLAIPLTSAAGVSAGLGRGIVVTSADAFEKLPRVDIVAIDKTGTLSAGDMAVVEVIGPPETAALAAAVERLSAHPVARAVASLDDSLSAEDPEVFAGRGVVAKVDGRQVAVGGGRLFEPFGWDVPDDIKTRASARSAGDAVISYVGWDGAIRGAVVTRDRSRPEWDSVIAHLRSRCKVVLLTGAEHPSGYEEHVDGVFAGIPSEAKATVIRQLQRDGWVVMIGDGSNDAPALAAADLGIAFGAPTPLAAEAADVVIPGEGLQRVFEALDLLAAVRRRVRQNLGWALLYNATAIPLAVAGYLNPLFAALAMSVSSLLVVWNSTRGLVSAVED